jgi:alpha-amylase/alpha-mannosidase (GH57 family)
VTSRFVAIHGHFYQPPRENPWLEAVEVEDSAQPFHDWNARVAAECYAPNTAARRMGPDQRIVDIVNNFDHISFDIGPTLFHWLARARPEVAARIVEADRRSAAARDGHGNAIAQVYGHAIMPLASRRDKVTQVRWGLADFRHRFGREAEGMWLAETAADSETLEVLAEQGVRFTILAPRQAARVRATPADPWRDLHGDIDPSRPYRWQSPAGPTLALFFYDGPVSQAVAFEGLLESGDAFAARLVRAFDDGRSGIQLAHVATDGESYGHHHRFGEMALAAACHRLAQEPGVALTNHAAFLAVRPPTDDVEIVERSSWSCVHGVERWRADCGCSSGQRGVHQRWRGPLREAFDWLRDRLDALFEARAAPLLRDPWAARDDYVSVILDRGETARAAFLRDHGRASLSATDHVTVWKLCELERQRLLMYASCGWFFDDISGVEAVLVMRCAARAIQLARELGGPPDLEAGFVTRLGSAPSNVGAWRSGDEVYRRAALPAAADLRRVIAHHAIAAAIDPAPPDGTLSRAFRLSRLEWQREAHGDVLLGLGRVRAVSDVTGEAEEADVAVLSAGGHEVRCVVAGAGDPPGLAETARELVRRWSGDRLPGLPHALARHAGSRLYGIEDLFADDRRRVLAVLTEGRLQQIEETCRRLFEASRALIRDLRAAGAPVPEPLAMISQHVLRQAVLRELGTLADGDGARPRVEALVEEARELGAELALDRAGGPGHIARAVLRRLARSGDSPAVEDVRAITELLDLGHRLGCAPLLWDAQNWFLDLWRSADAPARGRLLPLGEALGFRLDGSGPPGSDSAGSVLHSSLGPA